LIPVRWVSIIRIVVRVWKRLERLEITVTDVRRRLLGSRTKSVIVVWRQLLNQLRRLNRRLNKRRYKRLNKRKWGEGVWVYVLR
jgi:hypothetical protein